MPDPKLTPRKAPRQERARATVEAIVIAGERLTRQRGIEAWTTNHVAEVAGASIGSLYQYFPSKESLVVAMYLHRREVYVERLSAALVAVAKGSPSEVADAVARAWLDGEPPAIDWTFDLALREHLITTNASRKLVASDEALARLFGQLIERRKWATADAARSRGVLVVAAIERLLVPIAIGDPQWRTTPALRSTMIATLAATLGPV